MNTPIFRLFALFVVMFAVLVGFSSRWAVFGAQRLRENPKNSRVVIEEQRIKRGIIRADDGTILAANRRLPQERWARRYPRLRIFLPTSSANGALPAIRMRTAHCGCERASSMRPLSCNPTRCCA